MNAALKKVRARAKQLKKSRPGASYRNLLKQAGREYRAGKLKTRSASKRRMRKVGSTLLLERGDTKKKKPSRVYKVMRSSKGKFKGTRRVGSAKVKYKTRIIRQTKYRRVGAAGSGTANIVLLVALAAGAFLIYKLVAGQRTPLQTQYIPTGNYQRDTSAQSILAWAAAAGLTINAISKLIEALNTRSDSDIISAANSVESGTGLPPGFFSGD